VTRRQKAIAFFVTLCVLLVAAAVSLNIGWVVINARRVTPLILGIVSFALIIAGLIVYTVFLVLEIKRNEDHDTFINAVFNYPTLGDAYKYAAYDGLGNLARRS
jgi:hypothetical protein